MIIKRTHLAVLASCAFGVLCAVPAYAEQSWAGQSFLTDYSKLQPMKGEEGKDFAFVAAGVEKRAKNYTSVMLDQPEVFISAESPYKGAKPDDIAAIAGLVRSSTAAGLQERGYKIVDKPGPDVLYVRLAVTDLQIDKKKRNLLAYTPVGFVVDAGVKALQDFMDKYDVLDMSLQAEIQDSVSGDVLAAAVLQRGTSAGEKKRIDFDVMVAGADLLGDRLACRLDNAHVTAAQRIDCTDPVARGARPKVVGQ